MYLKIPQFWWTSHHKSWHISPTKLPEHAGHHEIHTVLEVSPCLRMWIFLEGWFANLNHKLIFFPEVFHVLHVLYLPNIPFMWWLTYLIRLYLSSIAIYAHIFLVCFFRWLRHLRKKRVISGGLRAGGLVQSSWPWLKVGDGCPRWPREKLLGGKTQLHKKEWDRNGVVEQVMFIFIMDWSWGMRFGSLSVEKLLGVTLPSSL